MRVRVRGAESPQYAWLDLNQQLPACKAGTLAIELQAYRAQSIENKGFAENIAYNHVDGRPP